MVWEAAFLREVSLFEGLNIFSRILNVRGPEMRTTAIAPTPGAVEIAQIVSLKLSSDIAQKYQIKLARVLKEFNFDMKFFLHEHTG
jgi:hypothetical protein